MGFWGDLWSGIDKNLAGGYLPGGADPNAPAAGGDSQYRDMNQDNFNLPGYQQQQDRYTNYLNGVDTRQAPTLGGPSQFAGSQSALADLLMQRAQGKNSVAEQQLRQGADMANNQQMSMISGARPQNAALAMRLGSENASNTMMGLSGSTALARAQEAQMAAMGLGSVLQGARGLDEQRAMSQAEIQQRQMAMNDAARQGLLGGSLQTSLGQQQGMINYEGQRTQRYGAEVGQPSNSDQYVGGLRDDLQQGMKLAGGV